MERAREAEMTEHFGQCRNEPATNSTDNTRNDKNKKTLKGEIGELSINILRDGNSSFEPKLVAKHQTRWSGFDDKIISLFQIFTSSSVPVKAIF